LSKKESRRKYYLANKKKILEANRNYALTHREEIAVYLKEYAVNNKEKIAQHKRDYFKRHPERVMAANRNWTKSNPGTVNAKTRAYQAAKLKRTPPWLTKEHFKEIEQFYTEAKELQWLSDPTDPLEVDHIVPLQGNLISGLHVPWNLQILPKSLNASKSNKCLNLM
jgi:5-methylcytosine-specific restriction endonuclease McrA